MPIAITITLDDRDPTNELDRALAAFGFVRAPASEIQQDRNFRPISSIVAQVVADAETARNNIGTTIGGSAPVVEETETVESSTETQGQTVRERGKPAPGRARRTKEEIAEDAAADAADAEAGATDVATDAVIPQQSAADTKDEGADEVNQAPAVMNYDAARAAMKTFMAASDYETLTKTMQELFLKNWPAAEKLTDVPETPENMAIVIAHLQGAK